MKKNICIFSILLIFLNSMFSQESTAKQIVEKAIKKGSPQNAITFVQEEIEKIQNLSEKRSLYIFLGSIQENLALFDDAQSSYAKAASIAAGDGEGMPKKSSERLVIDAVRCALSAGEVDNALQYLNTAVRNSKSTEIQAYIKLYEQWANLSKAENYRDTEESIAFLKVYLTLPSMKPVKNSILLTLWYITEEKEYANMLKQEFPNSMETEIINGNVQIMPSPFWFFVPRKSYNEEEICTPKTEIIEEKVEIQTTQNTKTEEIKNETTITEDNSKETNTEKRKLQLGLFRNKENAEAFVQNLKDKGFESYILEETKSSGNIYYTVIVDDNSEHTMNLKLKTYGYESYPIFN